MPEKIRISADNPHKDHDYPSHLTVDWLVNNKLPIYIRNITMPRGVLGINFTSSSGRTRCEKIPRTAFPICLTDRMATDTVQASDDLRQCLGKEVVELVRPDVAFEELKAPEAQVALERHHRSEFSAKNVAASKRVAEMEKTIDRSRNLDLQADNFGSPGVNARVMSVVERLRGGDLPVADALSDIKATAPEMDSKDWSYIISNVAEGQVKNYARKELASLQDGQSQNWNIEDDGLPSDMTPEEQAREAEREAQARALQNPPRPKNPDEGY